MSFEEVFAYACMAIGLAPFAFLLGFAVVDINLRERLDETAR